MSEDRDLPATLSQTRRRAAQLNGGRSSSAAAPSELGRPARSALEDDGVAGVVVCQPLLVARRLLLLLLSHHLSVAHLTAVLPVGTPFRIKARAGRISQSIPYRLQSTDMRHRTAP